MSSVRREIFWGVLAFVVLFAAWGACEAFGQRLSGDVGGGMEVWAFNDDCYQHAAEGRVQARLDWKVFRVEGFGKLRLWESCDAKIPSSPINAENWRVIEARHGAALLVDVIPSEADVRVGATVQRLYVHHVWRNKTRHEGFPRDFGWEGARERCQLPSSQRPDGRLGCPSIGYEDGIRPRVDVDLGRVEGRIVGPPYQWREEITLPWTAVEGQVSVQVSDLWDVAAHGQVGGPAPWDLYGAVLRSIGHRLAIGVSGGRRAKPGWHGTVTYLAATIRFR